MAKKDTTADTPSEPDRNARSVADVIAQKRAEVEAHPTLDLARKNYALSILDELVADLA